MKWHKVLATHEEEQALALGPWLGDSFPGIALPCRKALKSWVALRYEGKHTFGQVVDVGPWCIDDEAYVYNGAIPRAEAHKGRYCPLKEGSIALASVPDGNGGFKDVAVCNGAAIDLFPRVAKELGVRLGDNVEIEWAFVDLES